MLQISRRMRASLTVLMSFFMGVAGCLNSEDERPFLNGGANGYSSPYGGMNGNNVTAAPPLYQQTGGMQTAAPPLYPNTGVTPANASGTAPTGPIVRTQYTPPGNGKPEDFIGDPSMPGPNGMPPGPNGMPLPGPNGMPLPGPGGMPPPGPGGMIGQPSPVNLPRELGMISPPPHRVAPPDILYIEALRLVPKGPYRLSALEVLQIEVSPTLPKQEIKGLYMISPEGRLNLGHNYGSVEIMGLTIEQAQLAIKRYLEDQIKMPNVNIALVQMRGMQNIKGEHLVRPDGTVALGMYGSVYVAGMNLGQVKAVIENHLSAYLVDPRIAVDVFAYNSRKIYIIADGAGYGQQVIALPATGGETVLDAIAKVQGLPQVASLKKIWVARPSPAGHPCSQVLPIDWKAITQAGRTETNYELFPGDRIYISSDPLIATYNFIDKLVSPVERVLGVLFLGASTFQAFQGSGNSGFIVAH